MKATHILVAFGMSVVAFGVGAQGAHMHHMPSGASMTPVMASKDVPFVNAEVRKVDAPKGQVMLKHETITNLNMPPMTMAFPVADKKLLDAAKPGEKVRVKFESVNGVVTVTALEPTK